jgi:hypothetical protein
MGEEMSHWIDTLLEQDSQRREEIKEFFRAGQQFIAQLKNELAIDISEYKKHFTSAQVIVRDIKIGVKICRPSIVHGSELCASVYVNPIRKILVSHISPSERMSYVFPVSIADGDLVIDFSQTGVSRERLSSYILTPVLFPEVCNDEGILSYVEHQFGLDKVQDS